VEDEVNLACRLNEEIFFKSKANSLDKSKELGIDKVGYKSFHYVAKLKKDRLTT
jgi:putative GTP pyrophosphokinase